MSEKNLEKSSAEKLIDEVIEENSLDKTNRFKRNCRYFIDYINYDWESDKEWSNFHETNMKDIKSPK